MNKPASPLSTIPFVSVENMMRIILDEGIENAMTQIAAVNGISNFPKTGRLKFPSC